MGARLTHVVLGLAPKGVQAHTVLQFPRSERGAANLYRARVAALAHVRTPFFSFLDEDDELAEDYCDVLLRITELMDEQCVDIGYAKETVNGARTTYTGPHHGVVCRTSAVPEMPKTGCFHAETLLYGYLSRKGTVQVEKTVYDWKRGPNGAHMWPDTLRGILNSRHWLAGSVGVHFQKDF